MSRPIVVTQTATGNTNPIPMDINRVPYNIGVGCVISGTVTYKLQGTFDNIWDSTVTPTYFDISGFATTANTSGAITTPYTAIRASVTSGTGSVTVTLVPQGIF